MLKLTAAHNWTYLSQISDHLKQVLEPVTSYLHPARMFVDSHKKWLRELKSGKKEPGQSWDGRIRYVEYDRSLKLYRFPTGFLTRVTAHLDKVGYPYELVDDREWSEVNPIYTLSNAKNGSIRLDQGQWDYQAAALDKALQRGRGIIRLATGLGKSEVGAAIIASIGLPTVWLTHRLVLLYQTRKRLQERLQTRIGLVGDGICEPEEITVGMVQTLADPSDAFHQELLQLIHNCHLLIGDEIHHVEGKGQWYRVLLNIPAAWRFGLTATPSLDGPGMSLLAATGDILIDVPVQEGIARKVLVPPRIWTVSYEAPKIKGSSWPTVYKEGITDSIYRNAKIVDVAKVFRTENKSTLILVKRVKHGEWLADYLYQAGVRTEFVHGSWSQEERDQALERLWNHELNAVIGITQIFSEGVDIPPLEAIINATGTRGGGNAEEDGTGRETIQILGRGLRSHPGKDCLEYVDLQDTTHRSLAEAYDDRMGTLRAQGYEQYIKPWSERNRPEKQVCQMDLDLFSRG